MSVESEELNDSDAPQFFQNLPTLCFNGAAANVANNNNNNGSGSPSNDASQVQRSAHFGPSAPKVQVQGVQGAAAYARLNVSQIQQMNQIGMTSSVSMIVRTLPYNPFDFKTQFNVQEASKLFTQFTQKKKDRRQIQLDSQQARQTLNGSSQSSSNGGGMASVSPATSPSRQFDRQLWASAKSIIGDGVQELEQSTNREIRVSPLQLTQLDDKNIDSLLNVKKRISNLDYLTSRKEKHQFNESEEDDEDYEEDESNYSRDQDESVLDTISPSVLSTTVAESTFKTMSDVQKSGAQQILLKPCRASACPLHSLQAISVHRNDTPFRIGSAEKINQLCLQDEKRRVSRQHCIITYNTRECRFVLQDLGSTSGTYIKLHKTPVTRGMIVEFGFIEMQFTSVELLPEEARVRAVVLISKDASLLDKEVHMVVAKDNYFSIGYDQTCNFIVPYDRKIAPFHAKFYYASGALIITDQGSMHGTWQRLSAIKQRSDEIPIGNSSVIRIVPYCFSVEAV